MIEESSMGVFMSDNDEKEKVEKTEKKLSEEEKKALIVKLQKEMKIYEESEERCSKSEEIHVRRIDFTKALLYGIFYGIMGNLLVQYSYPVYEGLALSRFDNMFWVSVLIFAVSVIVIIAVTIKLDHELTNEERKFDVAWTERIASKWTKEDLKKVIEYLKQQ